MARSRANPITRLTMVRDALIREERIMLPPFRSANGGRGDQDRLDQAFGKRPVGQGGVHARAVRRRRQGLKRRVAGVVWLGHEAAVSAGALGVKLSARRWRGRAQDGAVRPLPLAAQ